MKRLSPTGRRLVVVAGLSTVSVLAGVAVAIGAAAAQAASCRTCDPGGGVPPTTPSTRPPTATLAWSLAPRSGGANDTDDVDALVAYVNSPDTVWLNGCDSAAGSTPIVDYTWDFNGSAASGCSPSFSVPHSGSFPVSLTVRDTAGLTASTSTAVTVTDTFVVALGDSIASGEGNPATPQPPDSAGSVSAGPRWPNEVCHRTPRASSQQAAASFEASHPHESVTYVNLACSGAAITNVLPAALGGQPYAGIEPDGRPANPPQLDVLQRIGAATGRTPDSVVLSAGANDFGFGPIATQCATTSSATEDHSRCADQLDPTVAAGQEAITANYPKLAAAFTQAGIPAAKVSISQYPNPTHDDRGALCDTILGDTPNGLATVHRDDVAWANGITNQLNDDVASAASSNGWHLVNGIAADFATHGYCAADHWINTWSESSHDQGNEDGTLHPNADGTADYATRILQTQTSAGLLQ
jgi:lysophospholipase L1-like esterase